MEGRHEATQVPWLHTSLRVIGVLSDLEVSVVLGVCFCRWAAYNALEVAGDHPHFKPMTEARPGQSSEGERPVETVRVGVELQRGAVVSTQSQRFDKIR
jgi:hypothetical protein